MKDDKLYRNEEWLYQKYIIENLTYEEIALLCGNISGGGIGNWIKKFNLKKDKIKKQKINCDYCGKEFEVYPSSLKDNKPHYCSLKCNYQWKRENKRENKNIIIKNCVICSKEYKCLSYNKKSKTCSVECRIEYTRLSKIGKFKERISVDCDWCGKELKIKDWHNKNLIHHFCDINCKKEFFRIYYSQTDEFKESKRITMINYFKNNPSDKMNSKPQLIINDLLNNININYINEYNRGKYLFDNYLNDNDLYIEVMGTYWHCDPRFYKEINYVRQKEVIINDKTKLSYIINKYDKNILYLWEYDINNNLELCKLLIIDFISNNGVLNNYHSFNYLIDNNILILNKDIIIPYMEYINEDLNKIFNKKNALKKEIHTCDVCGKEFEHNMEKPGSTKRHFCSIQCKNKFYNLRHNNKKE